MPKVKLTIAESKNTISHVYAMIRDDWEKFQRESRTMNIIKRIIKIILCLAAGSCLILCVDE